MAGRGHKADGFVSQNPHELARNMPENRRRDGLTLVDDGHPVLDQIREWVRRYKLSSKYLSNGLTFEETCACEMKYFERYGYTFITRHDSVNGCAEYFGTHPNLTNKRFPVTMDDLDIREPYRS